MVPYGTHIGPIWLSYGYFILVPMVIIWLSYDLMVILFGTHMGPIWTHGYFILVPYGYYIMNHMRPYETIEYQHLIFLNLG